MKTPFVGTTIYYIRRNKVSLNFYKNSRTLNLVLRTTLSIEFFVTQRKTIQCYALERFFVIYV